MVTMKNIITRTKKFFTENFPVFIPLIIFSFLVFPFLHITPCWDGATEFNTNAGTFSHGFFPSLYAYMKFMTKGGLHPPFKFITSNFFYTIGGTNIVSYHFMGITLGYLAIAGI